MCQFRQPLRLARSFAHQHEQHRLRQRAHGEPAKQRAAGAQVAAGAPGEQFGEAGGGGAQGWVAAVMALRGAGTWPV